MPLYRISWVIDLDAETPLEAAQLALEVQRDPNSIATVFVVEDRSQIHTIDLNPEHSLEE